MERDSFLFPTINGTNISTHTLTWSVTKLYSSKEMNYPISTHTLTWSVTMPSSISVKNLTHFNSHAHVERDIVADYVNWAKKHFNSHAHVERDLLILSIALSSRISTHTLTWSVTCEADVMKVTILFQLTRSRGA